MGTARGERFSEGNAGASNIGGGVEGAPSPVSSLQSLLQRQESTPPASGFTDGGDGPRNTATAVSIMEKAPVLKALLVAALFPQLVIAADTKKAKNSAGKLIARAEDGQKPEDIMLHPQCVAAAKGQTLDSPYLIYHEKVKTTRIFMR